ncbi:putative protein kinase CAMK-CDPK family [Helianthus anomalus]
MGNSCRGSLGDKEVNSLNQPKNRSGNGELPDQQPSSGGQIDNLNHPRKVTSEEPSKHSNRNPKPETVVDNDDTMNRNTTANQGFYVIGHKTENIRHLYTSGQKLGQVQCGTTYLCKENSKRKLISKEDVQDVRREIQIMHHLAGHKNIITFKGAYEDPLYVHIVLELCNGGELFHRIIQKGNFSERKAAELIKIIVDVIQACHSLRGKLADELKRANAVVLTYACDKPSTLERSSTFWLPELRRLEFGNRFWYLSHDIIGYWHERPGSSVGWCYVCSCEWWTY